MEKGSMKISHKYIGTPILGWLIRKKYKNGKYCRNENCNKTNSSINRKEK